jgi:hypothetical protein
MKEEDFKLAVAFMLCLTVSVLFSALMMPKKLTDQVIQKLKRDYVPGPYEPGFDPDKVPPGTFDKD